MGAELGLESQTVIETVPKQSPIFITGSTGALGQELTHQLLDAHCPVIACDRGMLDASMALNVLSDIIRNAAPRAIINCVALTGLDACYREPTKAYDVNGIFAIKLAALSNILSVPTIQISTESVFAADTAGLTYGESEATNPTTVYGRSKLAGEARDFRVTAPFHVLRLPLLYGPTNGKQIVGKLVKELVIGRSISVASDIYSTPVYTPDVATFLVNWLDGLAGPGSVRHLSCGKLCSLFDLLSRIARDLGKAKKVKPVLSSTYKSSEPKPKHGGLHSSFTDALPFELAVSRYVHWINQHERAIADGI